jgi:hypothetical protein
VLAGLATVAFLIAYIMRGAKYVGNSWWGPTPLLYLGLTLLAAHIFVWAWAGSPWKYKRPPA